MDMKKSIVSYADDDDDFETEQHHEAKKRSPSKSEKGNFKGTEAKERSRYELKAKESYTSRQSTQSSHHRHHHVQTSSRDDRYERARDHRRSRSRSPNSRHRRVRSRSRELQQSHRSGRHERTSSSKHEDRSRHKHSRSCRKSKRERSNSRSKESRNHRHRDHRSRSISPKRSDFPKPSSTAATKADHINNRSDPSRDQIESNSKRQQDQSGTSSTQVALSRAIAMIGAKAPLQQPLTAPAIPKFYNATAVNPNKIATQEEKRKLLWGDTKKEKSSNSTAKVWTNLQFQGERGSQMTEKFRKLMGIKSNEDEEEGKPSSSLSSASAKGSDISTTQETLFQDLEKQYQIGRLTTHTHRGVGLGFNNNRF